MHASRTRVEPSHTGAGRTATPAGLRDGPTGATGANAGGAFVPSCRPPEGLPLRVKVEVHLGWVHLATASTWTSCATASPLGRSPVTRLLSPRVPSSCISGRRCTSGRPTGYDTAPPRKPSSTRRTCTSPLLVSSAQTTGTGFFPKRFKGLGSREHAHWAEAQHKDSRASPGQTQRS
jgi:hypothetical protein